VKNPVVYADLSFLVNFVMDLALLWITARWSQSRVYYGRLLLASLLGALYGTGVLFAAWHWFYILPVKIAVSILMLWVSFKPLGWEQWKKLIVFFYLGSFIATGLLLALPYLSIYTRPLLKLRWLWWASGLAGLILIAYCSERYIVNKVLPGLLRFQVTLKFDDKVCSGTGFVDTGNALRDPLTRRPVIVAEYGLIRDCLPQEICRTFDPGTGEDDFLGAVLSSAWANRIRMIPYRSVGRRHGMMVGLRADEVLLNMGQEEIKHRDLVVGIFHDQLSNDDSYRMLVPAPLVNPP
jgi:stage II sporulation protein GA (sporulation sigma-E factor processing peptidase)